MFKPSSHVALPLVAIVLGQPLAAQATVRVSVSSAGVEGDLFSGPGKVSTDGRYVAFASAATNLAAGDFLGWDLFVRDLQSGMTELANVNSAEVPADADSGQYGFAISPDGRYVAFDSFAANLVTGDTNGALDSFVRDRELGVTERVSISSLGVEGDDISYPQAISADGRYVVFYSDATNLVGGDTNGAGDIFVRDRQSGTTERVSVDAIGTQANGASVHASMSADGRFVAFHSEADNLVPGDTNAADVFVRDRQAGTIERVSLTDADAQANGNCGNRGVAISADGRFVVFTSTATNLVPGDTNGWADVFIRDRQLGTTERVSVDSGELQANNNSDDPSSQLSVSAGGRYVLFTSFATNLVAGDTNNNWDVFLRDRQLGTTDRVSLSTGGVQGNSDSFGTSISSDGRYVVFHGTADNLVTGDTANQSDVFLRELGAGTASESTAPGGVPSNGGTTASSISADDRYLAFESVATNLVAGDTNAAKDVFVRDRHLLQTTRASVDSSGAQANGASARPSISADGRFVAFESDATNLVLGDTNGASDVFVRDLETETTARVSISTASAQGNGASFAPSISADGRYVAFESTATNLIAGDTNAVSDVFVRDRQLNTTVRVSISTASAQGNGASADPSISGDGQFVAFESLATNLVAGDTNAVMDVFLRDLLASTTIRVSTSSGGVQGNAASGNPSLSADGAGLAFESGASNIVTVPPDLNGSTDIFVFNPPSGMTRVSVASDGSEGLSHSGDPWISSDGNHVGFESAASNLVSGDTNLASDVFVHDLQLGATRRVSVDSSGVEGAGPSSDPSVSSDGRHVAFQSDATNLAVGDTNGTTDVFVHDAGLALPIRAICVGDGTGAPCPCTPGTAGAGCSNSLGQGARLEASGGTSVAANNLVLTCTGMSFGSASLFLQGTAVQNGGFGATSAGSDGLECLSGSFVRLGTRGTLGFDASLKDIVQRGAIPPLGGRRFYQVVYRNVMPNCTPATWNGSNGLSVTWVP